jgi:hypothetical protein
MHPDGRRAVAAGIQRLAGQLLQQRRPALRLGMRAAWSSPPEATHRGNLVPRHTGAEAGHPLLHLNLDRLPFRCFPLPRPRLALLAENPAGDRHTADIIEN